MARTATRLLAGVGALGLAVLVPVSTASAQSGEPVITNTETVNATLSPAGVVDVVRVYDQIGIQGSGEVSFSNPVSTDGLRNLDQFGSFTVEDGAIVKSTTVGGQFRQRSVSDFTKDLPVTIAVEYTLDGEPIEPGDLVGKSGKVGYKYTIINVTCDDEEITVDGATGPEKVTEQVCDPLAGSFTMTLPPSYTDVVPGEGGFVTAGDGRGGTLMNLSITLISGLTGSELVADFTAQVENAVIPPASMSIVPVVVDANPSATAQKEALAGGANSGQTLYAGAAEIDSNVLLLAEGAGTLLDGLLQLQAGGAQLSDGLVNTAAPGANQLAAGSADLADGLNNTAVPGSEQLAAGATTLSTGLNGQLAPGAQQLSDGLLQLQSAVTTLSSTVGATPEYKQLIGALDAIIKQIGTPDDTGVTTALGALNTIGTLSPTPNGNVGTILTKLPAISAALGCTGGVPPAACADVTAIQQAAGAIGVISAGLKTQLYDVSQVPAGCLATPPTGCGASQALGLVKAGIGVLVATIQKNLTGPVDQLAAGGTQLNAGVKTAAAGSTQVAAGAQQLSDGLVTAADGATQVADGNATLADGLQTAADGSVTLKNGLDTAAGAAPALPEGANRLSTEGMSQLLAAGEDAALSFGTRVAVLEASAERTADGGLPYGAPEGSLKAAAYKYDLNGASGVGSENAAQLVAGLALAGGAAAGATVLARRRSAAA